MSNEFFQQDAETAILSILLQNPESYFALQRLKSPMLSSSVYQILFSTIGELSAQGLIPETNLIDSYLKTKGKDLQVGGKDHLNYLLGLKYNKDNILEYERHVVDSYKARTVMSMMAGVSGSVLQTDDIDGLVNSLKHSLDSLSDDTGQEETMVIGDVLKDTWESIKERVANPGIRGVSTGIKSLDDATGGIMGGDLWIIAGRPGMGKTAQECNMILNQGKLGIPTLAFSLEMQRNVLSERLIAIETGVDGMNIRLGLLDQKSLDKISDGIKKLKTLPIHINSNFGMDLGYLLSTARKYKKLHDIKVIYLDYIQLLAERGNDATQEIGKISRSLKLLANELNIGIVVLSQFNRELEKRDNKRPILSDLKQSGSLEEDPDVVLGLYREVAYDRSTPKQDSLEEIILKQRNGPTGTFELCFTKNTNLISERHSK
jgi:replicative DNA helicase